MLKMTDIKSNDFAYFDSIENTQTRGAVKGAFRYIVNLSNLSGTAIDHWDIESVFMHDGKWLTDKGDINREFFKRKDAEPAAILNLPESLVNLLEVPLKEVHGSNLRDVKNNIANRERSILNSHMNIQNNVRELRNLRERLLIAEIAAKESVNTVSTQLKRVLTELPLELWSVTSDTVAFICKTDTLVNSRDIPNKINRTYNLGRLIFWVNVYDFKIHVSRQDIVNRWHSPNHAHFHYGSYFCYGGFSGEFEKAQEEVNLFALMSACVRWKDTYDRGSTLVSSILFNHHPAFTTYHEGDVFFGMDEKTHCEEAWKSRLYFVQPMTSPAVTATNLKTPVVSPYGNEYPFAALGGPRPGYKYEHEKPLDDQINRIEKKLIEVDEEELNDGELVRCSFDQYINWLCDTYEISDFSHGERAPDRIGYQRHTAYANTETGEWMSEDEWEEFESNNEQEGEDY